MSLPAYSAQGELCSTAGLSASLFAPADRYRLFAKLVYPHLAAARTALAQCYCPENGRAALEPVLLLGVSLLQDLDGMPDRQAVEMLRYHAGWNFALNRQLGDAVFHPTSLVHFRNRLEAHDQKALGFTTILEALEAAGLVSRQSRQRLDSTQMLGRVARMSRLDCVRETLRLALQELEALVPSAGRPPFWIVFWERYVESQTDYRASSETLARKLREAGADAWQLLDWLGQCAPADLAAGPQAQLLRRVFAEQFEFGAGQAAPLAKEPMPEPAAGRPAGSATLEGLAAATNFLPPTVAPVSEPSGAGGAADPSPSAASPPQDQAPPSSAVARGVEVQPKDKKELVSDRVQNPPDPEATYAAKGQGEKKKEHVGYKIQVAETVCEATLAPGEPTANFIVGILTHPAYESDVAGAAKMETEPAAMGLAKPPVHYVDAAYISAEKLAQATAEGRELIGPAPAVANNNEGRFTTEVFQVEVEQRRATCPAGHRNTQCSRLEEKTTGKVAYRFEWDTATCAACPLRDQCIKAEHKHRSLVVGEHHTALQTRRQEQRTPAFQQRMNHRNGIEGTQSELVRGHGMRRAHYRGLAKAQLQNYFSAAACNVKRWLRREAWKLQRAASLDAAPAAAAAAN